MDTMGICWACWDWASSLKVCLTKVCFNFFLNWGLQTRLPCTLIIRVSTEKDAVSVTGSASVHCEALATVSCTSGEELLGNQCSKYFPIFLKTRNFPKQQKSVIWKNEEMAKKKCTLGRKKNKIKTFEYFSHYFLIICTLATLYSSSQLGREPERWLNIFLLPFHQCQMCTKIFPESCNILGLYEFCHFVQCF